MRKSAKPSEAVLQISDDNEKTTHDDFETSNSDEHCDDGNVIDKSFTK